MGLSLRRQVAKAGAAELLAAFVDEEAEYEPDARWAVQAVYVVGGIQQNIGT